MKSWPADATKGCHTKNSCTAEREDCIPEKLC